MNNKNWRQKLGYLKKIYFWCTRDVLVFWCCTKKEKLKKMKLKRSWPKSQFKVIELECFLSLFLFFSLLMNLSIIRFRCWSQAELSIKQMKVKSPHTSSSTSLHDLESFLEAAFYLVPLKYWDICPFPCTWRILRKQKSLRKKKEWNWDFERDPSSERNFNF